MVRGILPPGGGPIRAQWGKAVAVMPAAVVQPAAIEVLAPSKPAQRRRLSDVVDDAVELKLGESCGSIHREMSISLRVGPPPPDIEPEVEAAAASSSAEAAAPPMEKRQSSAAPPMEKRQSSRLERESSSMSVDGGMSRVSAADGQPPSCLRSESDEMEDMQDMVPLGESSMVLLGESSVLPPPPPPAAFAATAAGLEVSRPAPMMLKRQSTKRIREEPPSAGGAEMMQVDQAPPAPPPRRSSSRMTGPGSASSMGAPITIEEEDSAPPPPLAAVARPSGLLARLPSKRMGRSGSSVAALLPRSSSCAVVPIDESSAPGELSCTTGAGPSLLACGSSHTSGGGAAAATAATAAPSGSFVFAAAGPSAATTDRWAAPPGPSSRFPAPPADRRRAAAANPATLRFPEPPQPTAMQLAAMRATAGDGGDGTFSVGTAAASGKAIWASRRSSNATKGARKR